MASRTLNNETLNGSIGWGDSNDSLTMHNSTITGRVSTGAGADTVTITTDGIELSEIQGTNSAGNSLLTGAGSDIVNISGNTNLTGGIGVGGDADTVSINISGTIGGDVSLGTGNDLASFSSGTITGSVNAGDGEDEINIAGGSYGGSLFGEAGSDIFTVTGFSGNLTIIGGEDNNDTDTDVLDLSGLSGITSVQYDANDPEAGTVTLESGQTITFSEIENVVPPICFTRGVLIETDHGEVAVEALKIGDLVRTYDSGLQPIRYIYSRKMASTASARPVVFEKGAIGNDRELRVSQGHRFLTDELSLEVRLRRVGARRFMLKKNHLIKAIELVNGSTIRLDNEAREVEYFHIMLEKHELLYAHGTVSESWQPHRRNLYRGDEQVAEELRKFFPEIEYKHARKNGGGSTRPEICLP